MDNNRKQELLNFYTEQLNDNILRFWLHRCEDKEHGGYFNCFDNKGENLVSKDKYMWSQGRFLWVFSSLYLMKNNVFSNEQRKNFLNLAHNGFEFLIKHALIGENDWRCVFLASQDGTPKFVDGFDCLDMSIYADCFVTLGMLRYFDATKNTQAFDFAKSLYLSIKKRLANGNYNTLPYPVSKKYKAHGIPMIMSNVAGELYHSSLGHDDNFAVELKDDVQAYCSEVIDNFTRDNVTYEIINSDNTFAKGLLGKHINPGHVIENMWFIVKGAEILQDNNMIAKAGEITKKALLLGWDEEFGGIFHYCTDDKSELKGDANPPENELTYSQVVNGWADKLWWPHSEALYATLLFYDITSNEDFMLWHDKVKDYTFKTFPNDNNDIGEWIQIRTRDGNPEEKVVALPVKDPYHIIRNFILIIEILND